ncbi:glycosyltransferase family 9 protein [Pseudomonadota bacterium]
MRSDHQKILIVRNDKLGDFMLAWPALATLKTALPNCTLHALVSGYTADIARLCPNIDQVVLDPGEQAGQREQIKFIGQLRREKYDAVITLYSTTRIGFAVALAGIPYRLAPATKFAQIFYHSRLKQRRSRSEKPEYVYNQDLATHYLEHLGIGNAAETKPPYLSFEAYSQRELRHTFCNNNNIPQSNLLVFIHPGCGGSANNLSIEQYAELGKNLKSSQGHTIVISAGPNEVEYAQQLSDLLGPISNVVYPSTEGLEKFSKHIAIADLFIAGSTGPLHIAGALNGNTAAFYPRRRSATALRWQTTNQAENRLAFSPPEEAEQEDMSSIDMASVAEQINTKFLLR